MSSSGINTLRFSAALFCLIACGISTPGAAQETNLQPQHVWVGKGSLPGSHTEFQIEAHFEEAPDLMDWAQRAGELCVQWYPRLATLLASDGFEPPLKVKLIFRKDMEGVAATSTATISIAANYVRRATNDFGMVIHELTHVVQSYPNGRNPGWLVEGVADYVRLIQFEPHAKRPHIDPDHASYRDAYKTTAIFFEWIEKNYDPQLIRKLNLAAREGSFKPELFKQRTGKTIDELWNAFAEMLGKSGKSLT